MPSCLVVTVTYLLITVRIKVPSCVVSLLSLVTLMHTGKCFSFIIAVTRPSKMLNHCQCSYLAKSVVPSPFGL